VFAALNISSLCFCAFLNLKVHPGSVNLYHLYLNLPKCATAGFRVSLSA
jgi:hypothetical protein